MNKVRDLARWAWYHRPVLTTAARLDDIEIAAEIRGIRYADQHPKGQVVTQPRLTLVVSQ